MTMTSVGSRFWSLLLMASCAFTQSLRYSYDELNRLTSISYTDGTTITWRYDAAGNRLSQIIANPAIPSPRAATDKTNLLFSATTGQSSVPQVVVIQNAGGGLLQWNATASVPWLNVTPASGTNAGAISVTASAGSLAAGSYTANLVIYASASNTPLAIPVTLTVTAGSGRPAISQGGVITAAGYVAAIARGAVGSLYGTGLADATESATSVPLPRSLAGVTVTVNGVNAPLWFVSPGQVNFQVPFEAPLTGAVSVVVTKNGVSSQTANVQVAEYAPGVFMYERGPGAFDPIVIRQDSSIVSPSNPTAPGEILVVYGTGLGNLTSLPRTGDLSQSSPLARSQAMPTITLGGAPVEVQFSGLTPGAVGLAQFNIKVPSTLPTASTLPLVIQFGSVSSPSVNLAVRQPRESDYIVRRVAGNGQAGLVGDGGPAIAARLSIPRDIAVDTTGNLFIADLGNNRIRKVDTNGTITTIAGTDPRGFDGDGGPATAARLFYPTGIAVDAGGNVYFTDRANLRVRKVNREGVISTVAGDGRYGHTGDGGLATSASLITPAGIAVDANGNIYVASWDDSRIRKISPQGVITTIGDTNAPARCRSNLSGIIQASLIVNGGLAVDRSGNLFVADFCQNQIRKISPAGVMTTVAGNGTQGSAGDRGPAVAAQLSGPTDVAVDGTGNLFIADYQNARIRKVSTDGTISTFAGTGVRGTEGDGGPAIAAQFGDPVGITVDASGNVYTSETNLNQRVRKIGVGVDPPPSAGPLPDLVVTSFTAPTTGSVGQRISGIRLEVRNRGNAQAGPFRMGFYLSSDAVISTSDRFTDWSCTAQNGLAAGALFVCTGEIGIPLGITPGTYYLGAYADDQFAVAESNVDNNYRVNDNGPIVIQ